MSASGTAPDKSSSQKNDNNKDLFLDAIHREISETQQRREKLGILKIAFVTALLGFGGVKIKDVIAVYQLLYLAPLAAFFFDVLTLGEHFSIRRMGAFLRLNSPSETERKYQQFVSKNRDRFFKLGSYAITCLSFVAAIALLRSAKGPLSLTENVWFIITFIVFVVIVWYANKRINRLDKIDAPSNAA